MCSKSHNLQTLYTFRTKPLKENYFENQCYQKPYNKKREGKQGATGQHIQMYFQCMHPRLLFLEVNAPSHSALTKMPI
jgi:hypothetical protein